MRNFSCTIPGRTRPRECAFFRKTDKRKSSSKSEASRELGIVGQQERFQVLSIHPVQIIVPNDYDEVFLRRFEALAGFFLLLSTHLNFILLVVD